MTTCPIYCALCRHAQVPDARQAGRPRRCDEGTDLRPALPRTCGALPPRLTSALAASDVGAGDGAAALVTNSQVMLELQNGGPARGAVLVPITISRGEMQYIMEYYGARLLIATIEFADAAGWLTEEIGSALSCGTAAENGPSESYEAWLPAETLPAERIVVDERALMAINYTSGPPAIPRESCTTPRGLSPVGGNGAPHCVAARQFLPCCAVAVLILGLECERGVGEHRAVAEHREHREHPALALGPVILIADPGG
jgi:hypothetical protein